MKRENPLAGLRVPSIEDIVDEALERFEGPVDLSDPRHKGRLKQALCRSLARHLRWDLARAIEHSCAKAAAHVFALMEDLDYQKNRRKGLANRKKNRAEAARRQAADREAWRQAEKGLVQ